MSPKIVLIVQFLILKRKCSENLANAQREKRTKTASGSCLGIQAAAIPPPPPKAGYAETEP